MKMKDSGVEWIGEIPEGWEVRPLKSIFFFGKDCLLQRKISQKKEFP